MNALSEKQERQQAKDEPIRGPGSRLRGERERRGLEQKSVAAQLHLSVSMVESLEYDDFDKLPGSVFVQGYLRNYAKLLDLPEDEIIEAYRQIQPAAESESIVLNKAVAAKHVAGGGSKLMSIITWLVVLILLILIMLWWQGRVQLNDVLTTGGEVGKQLDRAPYLEQPLVDEEEPPIEQTVVNDPAEALPPIVSPEADEQDAAPDQAPLTQALPEAAETGALVETEMQESGEAAETAFVESGEPAAADPEIAATLLPQPTPGVLLLEFSGKSWTVVRDGSGKTQIIGEIDKGSRREIDLALGPFQIVLGNAKVVNLSVSGKPYDLSEHIRGNVARFKLDPKQL